jgi:hypothetical protein
VGVSRITVTIDRLVLRGLEVADRKALAEGLQSELTRVLRDLEGPRSHRTPMVKLGRMPLEPGRSGARSFGGELARAIGGRLKP